MSDVHESLAEYRDLASKLCRMGDEEHVCFDGGSALREAVNAVEKVLKLCDETDTETDEALQGELVGGIRAAIQEALGGVNHD